MPKDEKLSMISGFDARLVKLIESQPSILIGTCDLALVPDVSRGFGAQVVAGQESIEVLISRWPGIRTHDNLEKTKRIAATFTTPETFESYQVKGQVTELTECGPRDFELSKVYTEAIRARIASLGLPAELVKLTFTARGLFRVRFAADSVFLQTPGKNAGQRL